MPITNLNAQNRTRLHAHSSAGQKRDRLGTISSITAPNRVKILERAQVPPHPVNTAGNRIPNTAIVATDHSGRAAQSPLDSAA